MCNIFACANIASNFVGIPSPIVTPITEVLEQQSATIEAAQSNATSSSRNDTALSVSVVTWNFAEKCPTENDVGFLKDLKGKDIIVLGVQECEDIKPRRHEGHRSRAWRALQKKVLGKQYKCIAQHKMGGLQMAVYGTKKASKLIQGMQILDVACGVGNVLTNKGGICVLLRIKGKTVSFINGHFAAHQNKVQERNADFHRILSSITARAQPRWLVKDLAAKRKRAAKIAKMNGGEPWLEQVFQFAGMPDDKGFAGRVRPAQLSPKSFESIPSLGSDDEELSDNRSRRKGVSGMKGKRKSAARSRDRSSKRRGNAQRDGASNFSSMLGNAEESIGLKMRKFGGASAEKTGPIVPTKRKPFKKPKSGRVSIDEDDNDDSGDADTMDAKLAKSDLPFSQLLGPIGDKLQSISSRPSKSTFEYPQAPPQASAAAPLELSTRNVHPTLEDIPFDAMVFLGDFNYRVDLPRMEMELFKERHFPSALTQFPTTTAVAPILATTANNSNLLAPDEPLAQLRSLLNFDQLVRERMLGKVFRGFREGSIAFLPTFKYDKGSSKFDTSAKARCPAWTDRILYASASEHGIDTTGGTEERIDVVRGSRSRLVLEEYYCIDSRHSDHRPVGANFILLV